MNLEPVAINKIYYVNHYLIFNQVNYLKIAYVLYLTINQWF